MHRVQSACLGYPRIGLKRQLKRSLELYWRGHITEENLLGAAAAIRKHNWLQMKKQGLDFIPSHDFSFYDQVLDTAVMFGAIPERYQSITGECERYFAMARGCQSGAVDVPAMTMTKWFDTNYHFIVPELDPSQTFALNPRKIVSEIREASRFGIVSRPVILGPFTFLALSKACDQSDPLKLLSRLTPSYVQLLRCLAEEGVEWVQIDEPYLVKNLTTNERESFKGAYTALTANIDRPRLMLTTYFGGLGHNRDLALHSGCEGLHVDLVRDPESLTSILDTCSTDITLSLGLVDGRNVWKSDLWRAREIVDTAVRILGDDKVIVAPSCSLLHSPLDIREENEIASDVKDWLAFSYQKIDEVCAIARRDISFFEENAVSLNKRRVSQKVHRSDVRAKLNAADPMKSRRVPFAQRRKSQRRSLSLPDFPTTTIGSFPQTASIRKIRQQWKARQVDDGQYNEFLREETKACIRRQEELGLDVLVHGEFERTDMVEYFGEKLEGFAFTRNGWVQSYGSRCVRPPILFGDVARSQPISVAWAKYAQSITPKPVKGMLTGPVTILQWSFVRDDQPRRDTCKQIALALRDEVCDLEQAGISMIQVDEPAIREGLPLLEEERASYLEWAAACFRLATSGVQPSTQIHTHMCYSEFSDILAAIVDLDADVLSVETSRSQSELLREFSRFEYPNEMGPGVYDIHSPRLPPVEEMVSLITQATKVLPPSRLWVNPDCGLKTRTWEEVEPALRNMVLAAKQARLRLNGVEEHRS